MATDSLEQLRNDPLALAVGRALALANEAASAEGVDFARSAIAVNEEPAPEGRRWRVY